MTITELKNCILKNKLPNDLIILLKKDNPFLAAHYLDAIITKNASKIRYIKSLSEVVNPIFEGLENDINILKVDTFEEYLSDYSAIKNTIIICESIDKSLQEALAKYIIKLPKFTDWQIKEYMSAVCPGLDESDKDWLYSVTNGDIFKINNELDKIKLFSKSQQTEVLTQLHYEQNTDLCNIGFYQVTDAILAKNKMFILNYFQHRNCIKLEPFQLISTLVRNFKYQLLLKYTRLTPAELDLPENQAWAIEHKQVCNYSPAELVYNIEFLSGLSQEIRVGKLDLPDDILVEYIICTLLSFRG